jgi:hypothetical protein
MYGIGLTLASALLLAYVLWRLSRFPGLRRVGRCWFRAAGAALALVLFIGRWLGHDASGAGATALEFLSMTLVGWLFLVFVCLFPVDLLTGFGRLFPRHAPRLRNWAITIGTALALLALFQGLRPPRLVRYEVRLPGLPRALDGTKVAVLSDLHLGALIGPGWLRARATQVNGMHPDLILLLGDLFEGHGGSRAAFLPAMRALSAPLGVWACEGNHETHGEPTVGSAVALRTLRNELAQPAPGLFLAGRRPRPGHGRREGAKAWNPGPLPAPGALILMAHVPEEAEAAAEAGVGLMVSGHTHGGQIWPLDYISGIVNPLLAGRYEVAGMTVLVTRGAGTWGPRMRLWRPGEIMLVTLRAP